MNKVSLERIGYIRTHVRHHSLLSILYKLSTVGTGIIKHSLVIDDEDKTIFSYFERGSQVPERETLIFIHGFSSNKESWIDLVKKIPRHYHCILVDMPYHGETTGLYHDDHSVTHFVEKLKLFFDKMNLTSPMCIIGTSMGSTVVSMFAVKYPQYISMICLMAPPPGIEYESDLVKQVRSGIDHIMLPATSEQFYTMIDLLVVKKAVVSRFILDMFFKSRLRYLNNHQKLLKSIMKDEYLNLPKYYEQLKEINCPTLILWGRLDKLCMVEGAEYFSKIIPHSHVVIYDDCGHFISYDKCEEAAQSIAQFLDQHSYSKVNDNSSMKYQWVNLSVTQTIAILCFLLVFIIVNENHSFLTY